MSKPHQPTAQTPVGRALPEDRDGAADAAGQRVRHGRQRRAPALPSARMPQALGRLAQLAAEVADQQGGDDDQAGDDGRDQREGDRARAGEDPDPEAEPGQQDGPHEDGVEQHQHRRHPERHERGRQPVAPKGPRRQGDASDAARREQSRRGQARQGDAVALRPSDPGLVADHAPEERHVAGEGRDLEEQSGGEPAGLALVEPPPGVAEAREVRQHDVESAQGDRGERQADQQLFPGYASGCFVHSPRKVPGCRLRLRVALQSTEVKNHTRFISDDPSVVPGRHVEAVAGPKLALGSIVHFQRHAAFEDVADVLDLA